MKKFIFTCMALVAFLFLAGCSSSKIIAKQEFAKAISESHDDRLSKLSVGILPKEDTPVDYRLEQFIAEVNQANVFKRVEVATNTDQWPDILISNLQDIYPAIGEGFQCFEPYLLIVTVGLVPATCRRTHTLSFDISIPKSKRIVRVEEYYMEKNAAGWLAKVLTPSEDGKFNGSKVEYLRALFYYHATQIEEMLNPDAQNSKN